MAFNWGVTRKESYMKKYIFLFINLVSICAFSQEWMWAKEFDTDYYNIDYGENIGVDKFGNAYITGYYKPWNGSTVRIILKYDKDGNRIWRKPALPVSKFITDPEGYSYAISNGKVYKFDQNGNYSLFISDSTIFVMSMAVDSQGGVVISGFTYNEQGLVARFDSQGNKLWQSVNSYYANGAMPNAIALDLEGNIFCLGYKSDTTVTKKFCTIKLNPNGVIQKIITVIDNPQMIIVDKSSDIYITNGGIISKYDVETGVEWTKTITSVSSSLFPWLMTDAQNNLYVTGHFQRQIKIDNTELIIDGGQPNIYVYKFDHAGNISWTSTGGGQGLPSLLHATLSSDNEIYFTGGFHRCPVFGSYSLVCNMDKIYSDMYVAKMKDNSVVSVKDDEPTSKHSSLVIHPNPSNGGFFLSYTSSQANYQIQLKIINVLGATVYNETITDFKGNLEKEMNLNHLKQGAYFIILQNSDKVETRKIIIQ